MGYCIDVVDHKFSVPAGLLDLAYVAACELNHDPAADKHGGGGGKRWFSWVEEDYSEKCKDLCEVLEAWRYESYIDPSSGDLILSGFVGEKIGDEAQLFKVLAPFVPEGSYIEYMGEDGAQWRYWFTGTEMHEVTPKIEWPVS